MNSYVKCKKCGTDYGLHHYQTNQCPFGGVEAPVGQEQIWMATTFEDCPAPKPVRPTGYAPQYIRELEETLLVMRAERDALVKALIRVKTGTCFCDVGLRLSLRHTPECDYAMSVLSESEAIAAAKGSPQ